MELSAKTKDMLSRLTPYLLFILAFCVFGLRNLDPITYPSLYAEDGAWTGDLLTRGFWDTAFNTRVFPILGFVIFYQVGTFITDVFLDSNLSYLPLIYFILSNVFLSLLVVFTYKILIRHLSKLAIISILIAILLLPVGGSGNEIYGRVLNLGFIFPFFQVILLIELFRLDLSKLAIISIVAFSAISGLTFPIGLGISSIAMCFMLYTGMKTNKKAHFFIIAALLLMTVVVPLLFLSTSTFTNEGGANLPFKSDSFVEFSIARAFLYPILFIFYKHLNDLIVIFLLGIVVSSGGVAVYQKWRAAPNSANTMITLLLWSSFFIYFTAMMLMRSGLTSAFNDYYSTFPDRYFTGLNLLFFTSLVFTIDKVKYKNFIILAISIPFLISINKRFELSDPSMKFDLVAPWTIAMCNYSDVNDDELVKINIPPKGWEMAIPAEISERHSLYGCPFDPFYKFLPFANRKLPVLSHPNPSNNYRRLDFENVADNNSVATKHNGNQILVDVIAPDPSLLFSLVDTSEAVVNESRSMMSINLKSEIESQVQLFYQTKADASFSGEKSIFIPINAGMNSINLSFSQEVKTDVFRFDLPDKVGLEYDLNILSNSKVAVMSHIETKSDYGALKFENVADNNGVETKHHGNNIAIDVVDSDPSLLFSIVDTSIADNKSRSMLSFVLTSEIEGQIQLFYQTKKEASFSAVRSVFVPIEVGANSINLSFSQDIATSLFRFDLPDSVGLTYDLDILSSRKISVMSHSTPQGYYRTLEFENVLDNNSVATDRLGNHITVDIVAPDPSLLFSVVDTSTGGDDSRSMLSFKLTSEADSRVQLFYQVKGEASFSAARSIVIPIKVGQNPIHLSFSQDVKVDTFRFDLPDTVGLKYDLDILSNRKMSVMSHNESSGKHKSLRMTKISEHNGVSIERDGHLTVVAVVSVDPGLLFSVEEPERGGGSQSRSMLSFKLISEVESQAQLFYMTKKDTSFSADKSIYIPIKSGVNLINLSFSENVRVDALRFDLPDAIALEYSIESKN